MNNQKNTSVTQFLVRRFSNRVNSVKDQLRPSRLSKSSSELDWDDSLCGYDIDLNRDQNVLRDLEAEIYSLTDQYNTEQGLPGARSV